MSEVVKVCVIGAGPSGLAACKTLMQAGISYDCYEAGSEIGGLWRYENDNGHSVVYRSLHINSSKRMSQFSDFPMPEYFPDFPHHKEIFQYLLDYTEHFRLRPSIQFKTSIQKLSKSKDGFWKVQLSNGSAKTYQSVIIASGHHWKPRFPEPPLEGSFSGETIHSSEYRTSDIFKNKDVLIVGMGNSAVDIACDAARTYSGKVVISSRSGAYIIPHYLFGRPIGELSRDVPSILPFGIRRCIAKFVLWLASGKQANYGIPKPKFKILSAHPTVSQEIFSLAGKGRIQFKPEIKLLNGHYVIFSDGCIQRFDMMVLATGFKISFPFLDDAIIDTKHVEATNELNLYRSIVLPEHKNLFFLGFIQPSGAVFPVVEAQSEWIAHVIAGKIHLPAKEKMEAAIEVEKEKMAKRFHPSKRHTIQVDYAQYMHQLKKDLLKSAL
jgi:dimethylaniline monooxygenase (N-oxide forming)